MSSSFAVCCAEQGIVCRQVKRAELYAETVRHAEAQLLLRAEALQAKNNEAEAVAVERQQRQKEARDEAECLRRGFSMMVRKKGVREEMCELLCSRRE